MLSRVISGLLVCAVALLLLARWMAAEAGSEGGAAAARPGASAGSVSAATGAGGADVRPEAPEPSSGAASPAAESPERRAARFQERVLRELRAMHSPASDGAGPPVAAGSSRRASAGNGPSELVLGTSGGPSDLPEARLAATGLDPEDVERIDWEYLRGVFSGRISGIPDERKAGISLQQMDALGDIPAIESLREQERFEELRDLGFENETIPWPVCLRTGSCRRDPASSP